MESRVMSNVLQVDFLGLLHINADGIVAIAAAVLIVIGVLVVLVAKKQLIPRLPKPQDDCGYDNVII
jgi:hypothetical protein